MSLVRDNHSVSLFNERLLRTWYMWKEHCAECHLQCLHHKLRIPYCVPFTSSTSSPVHSSSHSPWTSALWRVLNETWLHSFFASAQLFSLICLTHLIMSFNCDFLSPRESQASILLPIYLLNKCSLSSERCSGVTAVNLADSLPLGSSALLYATMASSLICSSFEQNPVVL